MLWCLYSYIVSDLLDQTLMSRPAGFYNCESSSSAYGRVRRKIRLIESNAKWRYLTTFTCKRTLRQVFYLSETPPLLWPHIPRPPLHTVYVYTVYLFTHGMGGGRANQREGERGNITQSRSKIPTWLTVSPVYKLYKTPENTTFKVWCLHSLLVHGRAPLTIRQKSQLTSIGVIRLGKSSWSGL